MSDLAIVTVTLIDSYKRTTKRSYQHRTADPSDADVNELVDALAAITRLGVVSAQVTKPVAITTTAASDQASRQSDARLEVQKSLLRDSRGGSYTFNLPHPKATLINPDGTLKITESAYHDWVELFDDGDGLLAVQGTFFVSDGEELIEAQAVGGDTIIKGFLYKD